MTSKRTLTALLARGVDSSTAKVLIDRGLTIKALKSLSRKALIGLGCSASCADRFIQERRDPIPEPTVVRVLYASRSCCCVCRDEDASVIIHHIKPYADSKDHSEENLVVLCLRHHGEAHTKRELSLNLSGKRLKELKSKWEAEVASLDTRVILSLANADRDVVRFDYINHFRIFEMAQARQLNLTKVPYYPLALSRNLITANGLLRSASELGLEDPWQRYDFGDGLYLYPYVFEVVKAVLENVPILNISDHLDRGFLQKVLRPGDVICVQGAHTFTPSRQAHVWP